MKLASFIKQAKIFVNGFAVPGLQPKPQHGPDLKILSNNFLIEMKCRNYKMDQLENFE